MPRSTNTTSNEPKDVVDEPVAVATQPVAQPVSDIALYNWCEAKSRTLGRRIEALSAFHRICEKNGVGRATAEQFEADFQKSLKAPA